MASVTPRFCWQNFAQFIGNIFTVSSEDAAAPHTNAIDQLRSTKWKSALGWTIVAGFNDKLDYLDVLTTRVATITPGTYETAAAMALEVETAINADATIFVVVTYDDVGIDKFTINRVLGAPVFSLLHNTGANAATSISADLGFDVSSDDTGDRVYTSDEASYQSRHFITIKLPASAAVKFGAVLDHNLDASSGVVTLLGNSSDSWTSPGTTQVLSSINDEVTTRHLFFAEQTYQWWRFLFDDVQNPIGFLEVGLLHFSDYFQPTVAHAVDQQVDREELTDIQEADQGAGFQNLKAKAEIWALTFLGMTQNDVDSFETMQNNRRIGRPLFFFFDPQNDDTDGDYFHLSIPISRTKIPPTTWSVQVAIKQSLG